MCCRRKLLSPAPCQAKSAAQQMARSLYTEAPLVTARFRTTSDAERLSIYKWDSHGYRSSMIIGKHDSRARPAADQRKGDTRRSKIIGGSIVPADQPNLPIRVNDNSGVTSRFPQTTAFHNKSPSKCINCFNDFIVPH